MGRRDRPMTQRRSVHIYVGLKRQGYTDKEITESFPEHQRRQFVSYLKRFERDSSKDISKINYTLVVVVITSVIMIVSYILKNGV